MRALAAASPLRQSAANRHFADGALTMKTFLNSGDFTRKQEDRNETWDCVAGFFHVWNQKIG